MVDTRRSTVHEVQNLSEPGLSCSYFIDNYLLPADFVTIFILSKITEQDSNFTWHYVAWEPRAVKHNFFKLITILARIDKFGLILCNGFKKPVTKKFNIYYIQAFIFSRMSWMINWFTAVLLFIFVNIIKKLVIIKYF